MKTLLTLISLIVLGILLSGYPSDAQIPRTINYQGSLKYIVDGAPVDGLVQITFAIYDSLSGGTQLWSESQTITVTAGIYSAILGTVTPLTLPFDGPYYLELTIDGGVLIPRQPLTSVPYAQRAASMDGITVKNGKVGIGISDPYRKLEVDGWVKGTGLVSPFIRISRKDGTSSGYLGDIEGSNSQPPYINWEHHRTGGNPIRYGYMQVGDFGTYRLFKFVATNGANFAFRNGSVGINTDTPQYKLDVAGIIRGNNVSPSDARFKEDISRIDNALDRLSKLRGVSFRWKTQSGQKKRQRRVLTPEGKIPSGESFSPALEEFQQESITEEDEELKMGLVAQEVERVFPEVVYTDSQGYKSIAYGKLVAPLIEAVKTLEAENTRYQNELETIKKDFERRIAALEATIHQQQQQ